jgi:ketosteroid isomerase-like protein
MVFTGSTADRLAIHELVAAYGDAVSCNDADAWGATWAEDSIWELPNLPDYGTMKGRDEIVRRWVEAMAELPLNVNIQTLGALEVNGDTATGRTWTSETVVFGPDDSRVATGVYDDEFIKIDGQWLFKRRTYKALHST